VFPFGESTEALGDYAWHEGNSGKTTHPVGTRKPNPWGLYDVIGNVWEWCEDWMGPYEEGVQTDPRGPATGEMHVLRGGAWRGPDLFFFRSATRYSTVATDRHGTLGLRAAMMLDVAP